MPLQCVSSRGKTQGCEVTRGRCFNPKCFVSIGPSAPQVLSDKTMAPFRVRMMAQRQGKPLGAPLIECLQQTLLPKEHHRTCLLM